MRPTMILLLALAVQVPQAIPPGQANSGQSADLEKSAYFAFVDHDYIFTVEVIKPGVALLNFVSMTDTPRALTAKQVRAKLANRTVVMTYFIIDTGDAKQPITAPSLTMRPRSSFGARMQGDYADVKEFEGVSIQVGDEDLKLDPLTSLAFENLVLKVNKINLDSPDFRDDWRAVKLEVMGSRSPVRRR